ncbi:MAG: hypothetical protein H7Y86_04640 [Rhizobacter sp.]|nr:hypothetical protein [Ferruginibacter sp.]
MKKILNSCLALGMLVFAISGCDKYDPYDTVIPPTQAHFMSKTILTYQILTAGTSFKVPVGITNPSNVERKVTVNITSATATAGTDYTVTNPVLTIPAGKVIDSLEIKGTFTSYQNGEKDTLILAIIQPDIDPSSYNDTLRLVLRGPCFEGDVTRSALLGNFRAIETFGTGAPYGPYATTVPTFTTTSPTTGVITVTNIWDNGWGPIQFNVDWTDPANRIVTAVAQAAIPGSNAGDLNALYAGQTVAVRAFVTPTAANTGTFSACNQTFTLRMQLGVTGVGFFGSIYTVNLSR